MSRAYRRASAALLLCAAVAAAVLATEPAAGSPAATVTVSPGDGLYGVSCDFGRSENYLEVLHFDGLTSTARSIGSNDFTFRYFCGYTSTWDHVADSCIAYTLARDPDDARALVRTDLATGTSTLVKEYGYQGDSRPNSVAVDGNGAAWALAGDLLYALDVTSGNFTNAIALPGVSLYGLTTSAADGLLYAHDGRVVYRIDPATGTVAAVTNVFVASGGELHRIGGMTIDSSGTLWFSQSDDDTADLDPAEWTYSLWRVSSSLMDFVRVGTMHTDGYPVGALSLLAVPEQACPTDELPTLPLPEPSPAQVDQLAVTGGQSPIPVLVGGALTMAVGALFVGYQRVRGLQTVTPRSSTGLRHQ